MTNKTHNQCLECGHQTVTLKLYEGGSGKVYCKRNNCEYQDKFSPDGEI